MRLKKPKKCPACGSTRYNPSESKTKINWQCLNCGYINIKNKWANTGFSRMREIRENERKNKT